MAKNTLPYRKYGLNGMLETSLPTLKKVSFVIEHLLERSGETAKLSQMVSFTMNDINHKIELKGFKEKDAWFELKTTSTNEIVDGFLVRFDLIRYGFK